MIYLVRHGQTDWNLEKKIQGHTDIPLNNNGISQAKSVLNVIKKFKINEIYSSDLLRAKETAEIINKNFKTNIMLDNRLREIGYGDLEGSKVKDISQEMWDMFNNSPRKIHAEPISDVYTRIKNFFEELDINNDILIVTHGGTLKIIMYYINNKNVFDKKIYDNQYRDRKIQNCAIYGLETNNKLLNIMR